MEGSNLFFYKYKPICVWLFLLNVYYFFSVNSAWSSTIWVYSGKLRPILQRHGELRGKIIDGP